jgi:O-methyltransferase
MNYIELIDNIIQEQITLVDKPRFETILRHKDKISNLNGDIVECGIWRGGMSIFMAHLFEQKNIWMCDSFVGFQPLNIATYQWADEPHVPSYDIGIHYDIVANNINKYNLRVGDRIKILKGWVKDTLAPSVCPIEKISLLRIDVDAYSATREVLDFLYPKVVKGGYIIFDDSCLTQTVNAFYDYFEHHNIPFDLLDPVTDEVRTPVRDWHPCGSYIIKK